MTELSPVAGSMAFTIELVGDYLRADIHGRETVKETRGFLKALVEKSLAHGCDKALISVHTSRAIFKVEEFRFSEYLKALAARPEARVALVGDSDELRSAHEYIELLARQKGVNLRAFAQEQAAVQWLRAPA